MVAVEITVATSAHGIVVENTANIVVESTAPIIIVAESTIVESIAGKAIVATTIAPRTIEASITATENIETENIATVNTVITTILVATTMVEDNEAIAVATATSLVRQLTSNLVADPLLPKPLLLPLLLQNPPKPSQKLPTLSPFSMKQALKKKKKLDF